MRRTCWTLLALLAFSVPSLAQIQIDKRRPARARGQVAVSNPFGSVEIVGWDREEVAVTGRLAAGAEGFDFDGDEDGIQISVEVPESWMLGTEDDAGFRSELTIQVPRASSVAVETTDATVIVRLVTGAVEVESLNGAVTISGESPAVEVETMTGTIEIDADGEVSAESISGGITIRGARRSVGASSVTGAVRVEGRELAEVEIESTSGDVAIEASLAAKGELAVETHGGNVELVLPGDVRARFECVTFSGHIESAFPGAPRREGRKPHTELHFATALDDDVFEIGVETFSGNITLRQGGAPSGASSPERRRP